MKRKIVKIMVAVVAVGALLASCGSTETTIDKEIVENVEEEVEEATEEVAEEPVLEAVAIEETVLLDESGIKITATGLEDGWLIAYVISYMLPLANIVLDDFNLLICGIVALILTASMPFVNTAMPNPLLFIIGYHFYQISAENGVSGYVLISKRKIRRKKDLRNIKRIFEFLLLDVGRA